MPGLFSLLQSAQIDSVNPGGTKPADVRWFLLSSGPEVLASIVTGDVWPLWVVATPPVELATWTQVFQLYGLASTRALAVISFVNVVQAFRAIVTQHQWVWYGLGSTWGRWRDWGHGYLQESTT